ncbi:hypothetical protein BDW60DRAFT_145355 [Aspergillus nidulans var. acristatus]
MPVAHERLYEGLNNIRNPRCPKNQPRGPPSTAHDSPDIPHSVPPTKKLQASSLKLTSSDVVRIIALLITCSLQGCQCGR